MAFSRTLFSVFLVQLLLLPLSLSAQQTLSPDTLTRVLDEVTVTASPRENVAYFSQPLSYSSLSESFLSSHRVTSLKNLSGLVPGLFIPSYGSRQTSAVYIRGVGSRINTPAVALYVDNIPLVNKNTFDFNYQDLDHIEVLKGSQATLYGRNAMAGVIHVHTLSPFQHQGTRFKLTAATYGTYRVSLTHAHRFSDRLAMSFSGFVNYQDGFFRNVARGNEKVDRSREQGLRLRSIWMASENTKVDLSTSFEHLSQGAWPYLYTGALEGEEAEQRADRIGKVSYDHKGAYGRNLLNTGLVIQHTFPGAVLSSMTSYQYLRDHMDMDQDYTELPIFTLYQRQKSHVASQEIVLKSRTSSSYDWVTGLSASYSALKTHAPVGFLDMGVTTLIEDNVNGVFRNLRNQNPRMPEMMLDISSGGFDVRGDFSTPTLSMSLYHQSTLNDLLVEGLSLTLGARLQYEKDWIHYDSGSKVGFDFLIPSMSAMPQMAAMMAGLRNLSAEPSFAGKLRSDDVVLLPKIALEYEPSSSHMFYASLSKGYRSKGYNVQMFSDLVKNALSAKMMTQVDEKSGGMVSKMGMSMPQAEISEKDVEDMVAYKPEYSWNLEAGARQTLLEGRLSLSEAAFLMRVSNLQISKFAEGGLGRMTVNAGRSRSMGLELSASYQASQRLLLNASWGYTHATFRSYKPDATTDYRGNFVPFVPRHTLYGGARYHLPFHGGAFFSALVLDASVRSLGPVYWTEDNHARENMYALMDLRATLEKGRHSLTLWVENALDKDYTAFYFESLGKGLRQRGNPLQIGLDLSLDF